MMSLYAGQTYEFELTRGPRLVGEVDRVRPASGEVVVRHASGKLWILNPNHIVAVAHYGKHQPR